MLTTNPTQAPTEAGKQRTWAFLGSRALPEDPGARLMEKRGRRWLIVSYVLCPCHLPVTLGLLGLALGGTALGTAVAGNAGWVAIILTGLYAAVLWRGFQRIRLAKRLEAQGLAIDCSTGSCTVQPAVSER